MNLPVASGATLLCTCSAVPSALLVPPRGASLPGGRSVATILDHAPLVNVPPFGVCTAPGNPVPGPLKPCLPQLPAPWILTVPEAAIPLHGVPVLPEDAVLLCAYGGVISVAGAADSGVAAATAGQKKEDS